MTFTKSFFVPLCLCGSFLLIAGTPSFSQTTQFSQENATAILKTLAVEIGRRPMGSPNEQRAMQFAVSQFKEYGCDTSYIMPMTVASGVNTNSGVAIGVKKGKTQRIIVIGGHIDTTPDAPGANDDGSGTACVIELARVLCQRENESTIYFCCWGGEEVGLEGSEYFVENFSDIDSVALMLQIDMADGAGKLLADPDGTKRSAPSWLVKAAFDIFYNELSHSGLEYATEDATWNLAVGGAWGSDHSTFIDEGIPAIDFTSDPAYPIHTPQDNWENFTPSGLKRTGDVVLRLFERYDGGVPSRTTERYQLFQIGTVPFFISYPVIWVIIVVSFIFAVIAFAVTRGHRLIPDPTIPRVKWSRFKLFIATLVVQTFIWSSESIVGFIKGYRFPWVNNLGASWLLGILFGFMGLWLVLRAARKYPLSENAFVFSSTALILLSLLTALASLATVELGMLLAVALLALAVSLMTKRPAMKLLLVVLSFLIVYHVIFFDGLGLFQRLIASNQMSKWWQKVAAHAGFVALFTFLSLPFAHAFAAVYRGSSSFAPWLRKFQSGFGIAVVMFASLAVAGYLLAQPVYDKLWFNDVRVEQKYTIGDDSTSIAIRGSEYLNGLKGSINGSDTTFVEKDNYALLIPSNNKAVSWSEVKRMNDERKKISDSTWEVRRNVEIHSAFRPFRIDAWYESEKPFEIESSWVHGAKSPDPSQRENERRKRFRWQFYPDTLIVLPVTFTLRDSQLVSEKIEITYDSIAYPIRLHRGFTNISYRTIVTSNDSLRVSH